MKIQHLIGATLATMALAFAGPAAAATFTAEPLTREQGGLAEREPPIGDGGGYPGCWRAYAHQGEGHFYGSWGHNFNPLWCGNGWVITYVDPSWHYQTANGLYGFNGTSRWRIGGCVGCPTVQYHAQGRFSFTTGGWTSHFGRNLYVTLLPSNGLYLYHG